MPLSPVNVTFMATLHLIALGGSAAYFALHGFSVAAIVLFGVWAALSGLGITAGYHRLFSHVSYESHWSMRLVLLLFGAAAFENSAYKWARTHRRHHLQVDTWLDPYSIKEGFWNAHIGWVLRQDDPSVAEPASPDLDADRLVQWQNRFYWPIAIGTGLIAPMLVGLAFGDFWGGLVIAGFLRILVIQHATFSINSFAHALGKQPYSDRNSSRDSVLTALISMGEGYHNFHHTFPGDYRNGVRRYQFDPTKWVVRGLSFAGITWNLNRTPEQRILLARIQMQERALERRVRRHAASTELMARAKEYRQTLDARLERWRVLAHQYRILKRRQAREMVARVRVQIRMARAEFRASYSAWKEVCRRPELALTA